MLTTLMLASCKKVADNVKEITFEESNEKKVTDAFSHFHCVQLETNDVCLISQIKCVKDVDGIIIVLTADDKVFTFDRQTGKFLHVIGHKGEGPMEYVQASDIFVTKDKKIGIVDTWKHDILYYSFDGKFMSSDIIDNDLSCTHTFNLTNDGNLLVGNDLSGEVGMGKCEYSILNLKSKRFIKSFSTYEPLHVKDILWQITSAPVTECGDHLSFIKAYNDTLFRYNSMNDIVPLYKLNFKKGMLSREKIAEWNDNEKRDVNILLTARKGILSSLIKIFETKNTIMLASEYSSLFEGYFWIDKKNHKGYHVSVTKMNFDKDVVRAIEGKVTIGEIGSNENEMIFQLSQETLPLFKKAFKRNPDIKPFSPELKKTVEKADAEGNPVMIFYEH